MEWRELLNRRTVRFFRQEMPKEDDLRAMLEAARCASCGANAQVLRYMVIRTPDLAEKLFHCTAYAALVKPRRSPVWGVNAARVYFAVLAPPGRGDADAGAALQSMEFAAYDRGLGCCWVGAFDHAAADRLLAPPEGLETRYLMAVGYPAEPAPVRDDIGADGKTAYYLDADDRLHVPKFTVDALTVWK